MQIQCVFFPEVNVSSDHITSCGDATFSTLSIGDLVADNPQWFFAADDDNNIYLCTITLPNGYDITAEFTDGQTPYTATGQSFVGGRPVIVR